MPASGKNVDVQLIDITRFGDDGLAHEHWGVFDALSMMQQLGAIQDQPGLSRESELSGRSPTASQLG